MGCIQDVCRKDEEQGLSRIHLAAKRGDTEAVGSALVSSEMSRPITSAKNTAYVSGETRSADDVDDARSAVELHHSSDAKYVESDDETMIVESDGSKTSEHSYTPSESKELHQNNENNDCLLTEADTVDEECDIQDVCEKDEEQGLSQLHLAAERGDMEAVRSLLMSSANVDVLDTKHNTPLHYATLNGHANVVELLLNKNANVNSRNALGLTSLHLASENGHFEVIGLEVLLKNKANVNIRNASCKTPLHIAAEMGYVEIVKAMIDHKGEVNAADINGDTALHLAARNGHRAVVNVLFNQTAGRDAQIRSQLAVNEVPPTELGLLKGPIKNKVDVDQTSNQIAAEAGNVEIIDIQLSQSSTLSGECRAQATTSHLADEHRHAEIVENLIFHGANVNACNNVKMTPLHLACQNGHTSIVEILLDNPAIVDITKQSKETPLYLATKNGHAGVLDLLMRRGVYDFVAITSEYETPLQVAIEEGHTEVAEVILKHSFRLYEKFTKDLKTTLSENTKRSVMPAELMKIDGRRVSAELVWREGITPLKILCDLGKDVEIALKAFSSDQKMDTLCLSVYQCIYSEADIAERFRDMVTNIPSPYFSRGFPSDLIKYRMNFRKDVQFLMNSSKFIVNLQDKELNTFLHHVIWQENAESKWLHLQKQLINDVIQLLLEKGADFNMKNSDSVTPLMVAAEKDNCHAIQIFFDWEQKSGMKLDLDARNLNGRTALIKAAGSHYVSVMRLLLNHKASVNLQDYNGFTALHAAIYEPNKDWVDFHFFCKGLRKRKFDDVHSLEINSKNELNWENEIVDLCAVFGRLQRYLECNKETTRFREEVVKMLLDNDETNVNVIDFRGNTPLDLAVKSSKRISSATFKALQDRGAIRKSQEPEDDAPIDVARVDERGRNPLHRLALVASQLVSEQNFGSMIDGILLRREKFRNSATATDDKGRTPLHYAVMPQNHTTDEDRDLAMVLLEIGSKVNAADMYGKTPLHYAEANEWYELLVQCGADESKKDAKGHTPRTLSQLRKSVTINKDNTKDLPIGKNALHIPRDSAQVVITNRVTDLTNHRRVETIRIYSQSSRPRESSEEAIWKLWTENDLIRFNRRLSQLKPLIQHFIERLADGIKEKDWRFECQPTTVGSTNEETKRLISADFDFTCKLIKFSQFCDPFPHPLGPKGYFKLRRKPSVDIEICNDGRFACFFNSDQCLLTNEVNFRFQIILEEVLGDHNFWKDEHLLELDMPYIGQKRSKFAKPACLCKTVLLKMIHPIEDEEDGFLFVKISIDIVACVHVEGFWPEDPLPGGISPSVKTDGSTFVLHRPRFDPTKSQNIDFLFSDTFARISFAPIESRIIKESSPLIKAAYMVCKMILHCESKTTYQLKNCLLFCMEALKAQNESKTRNEDKITPKQLTFWVERIMFCFTEFSRHRVYPCYFMPSFKQQVAKLYPNSSLKKDTEDTIRYSAVYDIYLDLCPDDTAIDIPMDQRKITGESFYANCDSKLEQFDREEFIRKLSSRSSSKVM